MRREQERAVGTEHAKALKKFTDEQDGVTAIVGSKRGQDQIGLDDMKRIDHLR